MAADTKKQDRKETPESPDALRREAGRRLAGQAESLLPESGSPEKLIHELQVHQIELEMQNEALREARLALEESRDKYLDLYEFAPVGYLTLSDRAVIEEANLMGAALFGVDRRKLVRDRFRRFIDPGDLERWDQYFVAVRRSTVKTTGEFRFLKGDGSRFHARVESVKIERSQKDPVVRMAIIDITEQKRTEVELAQRSADIQAVNEELTTAGDELRRNEVCLTQSLEEKEALLSEVHHRVKNNLAAFISLLALDGTYEDSPAGRRLKQDLQNRARSMALIHETLYQTRKFSTVDMNIYLTTLTGQLAGSYQGKGTVRTIIDADGVSLDLARATPCGLIINELITNSFKYAFPASFDCAAIRHEPCTLRVSIARDNGMYVLVVADNGVGFAPSIDPKTAKSFGLKLVNFLARHQLRATVQVSTDKGTEYSIRFPEKKPGST